MLYNLQTSCTFSNMKPKINTQNLDMNLPAIELARVAGCSLTYAYLLKRKAGIASNRRDFSGVDWTKSAETIAQEMGVSVHTVRFQRRKRTRLEPGRKPQEVHALRSRVSELESTLAETRAALKLAERTIAALNDMANQPPDPHCSSGISDEEIERIWDDTAKTLAEIRAFFAPLPTETAA